MRKKLLLVLVVTLLAIATVAVFAACNDSIQSGDGASGNSPVIDIPFVPVTEGTEGLVYTLFDENSWAAKDGIDISGYWVTGYKGNETDVVIPNMYEGKRVIGIMYGAFYLNTLITSVNISNGIKYLGIDDLAEGIAIFYSCVNLKSVTLPLSLTTIGDYIFMNCPSITSVTIPANVSEITINPFLNCENLTEVKVSKDNGNYYSDSKYLYEKKTNKIISAFNVGSSVTIPDRVKSIGVCAFYMCESLTSVIIPDSVTSIGDSAFSGCESLTSVTMPDSVTSIGDGAFWDCTSLTSVTIPDSVTSIGYGAFWDCTSLTSVTIGNSVTSIGEYAFDDTPYYKNLPDGEVYLGKVLYKYKGNMPSNYSVIIKEGTVSISDNAFEDCTSLTSVTIPDSVTSIGGYAFYYCTSLSSVTIPDSVTSIGNGAFYWCTSLTSITIPDSVTSIGNSAFSSCEILSSVYITDINAWFKIDFAENVISFDYQSISNPLYYAENFYLNGELVKELNIPDFVTSIDDYAFYNCTSLTSVTIPDSVTSIGDYAFRGCTLLTSITIPDSVTSIGD